MSIVPTIYTQLASRLLPDRQTVLDPFQGASAVLLDEDQARRVFDAVGAWEQQKAA